MHTAAATDTGSLYERTCGHTHTLTHAQRHAADFLFFSPHFFCSHLPGTIRLSNPFPYIKWGFPLHVASSSHSLLTAPLFSSESAHPVTAERWKGKRDKSLWPLLEDILIFLFLLKKTGVFFSFCLGNGIEQNKQVVPPSPPLDCSYFRLGDLMRESGAGSSFYGWVTIQSNNFWWWSVQTRAGCTSGTTTAAPQHQHQQCLTGLQSELGTLFLTGRTQSRLSRWCQAGTLCTKCVANLVNSQCRTLQGLHLYRWPTVQIQASRICNFIFQVLCRCWSWHINGSGGSLELQEGLDQETHFDLAGNVKNKKTPKPQHNPSTSSFGLNQPAKP